MAQDEDPATLHSKLEEEDPWALPELKINEIPWSELTTSGKFKRAFVYIIKIILLIGLLYLFIVSLDFLGSAFQLLGGKDAGRLFAQNELLKNPVCGLMIGVLVTVLVQSSSTSTSIIITMTGKGLLNVDQAVYIIMGANIGTSVTNTIVALGQAGDRNEFRRAFAGATVHDMFNWLCVCVLLPLEVITGMLRRLTGTIVDSFHISTNAAAKKDLLKVITKPFAKLVVATDKKVIEKIALNDSSVLGASILKRKCKVGTVMVNETNEVVTLMNVTVNGMVLEKNVTTNKTLEVKMDVKGQCHNLFAYWPDHVDDKIIGGVLLIIALFILCTCLICIIKLLHSLLKGTIAKTIRKYINAEFPGPFKYLTGYVAILLGAGLTILVQSSSIFTSTMTPLVGIGVITIDRMYPLTLGANIGTTATGILASLVNEGQDLINSLQLALCHLFFNIIGILIWYPIPFMRIPIPLAKGLGNTTAKYRWFAIFYIFLIFLIVPGLVFGLSFAGWKVLLGVGAPILGIVIIILLINVLQRKAPRALPRKLRSWDFLPQFMHSLKPFDKIITRLCICKCCKCLKVEEATEGKPIVYAANGLNGVKAEGEYINETKTVLDDIPPTKQNDTGGHGNKAFEDTSITHRTTL